MDNGIDDVLMPTWFTELWVPVSKTKAVMQAALSGGWSPTQDVSKIAQKLGEEAVETVIAATARKPDEVATESADLLYHLLVTWVQTGIKPETVWAELARREGISGVEEKRGRKKG